MCGRYTLAVADPASLRRRFPLGEAVSWRPRYNVAPGDDVLAVTTDRDGKPRGELLRWGLLPSWSKQPETPLKLINARVEGVRERPAFRASFERYRCLIPADGFYEWRTLEGQRKQPFHITRSDHEPFAFAGLWSVWYGEGEATIRSCAILTTQANEALATLHDRMPVILKPEYEEAWLRGAFDRDQPSGDELLAGLPASMTALRPVGAAVNDARYDGPECLASAVQAQPSLF